jgi:1-phosphatidylinositol-4-phosphate 5-kinase
MPTNNATIQRNESEAMKGEPKRTGREELEPRVMSTARSVSADRTGNTQGQTLPVVEELGESSSLGGKSARSREKDEQPMILTNGTEEARPVTPMKDFSPSSPGIRIVGRSSLDKELPPLPQVGSPEEMRGEESMFR